MSPESMKPPELTEEQTQFADFVLELGDLREYANLEVGMYGQTGTLQFGLARCTEHLIDKDPEIVINFVKDIVKLKLAEKAKDPSN